MTRRAQTLVERHLAVVGPIASKIRRRLPPSISTDELVAAGYFGLVDAAMRWCPGPAPFAAYCRFRIRGAMLDYVRSTYADDGHDALNPNRPGNAGSIIDAVLARELLERLAPRDLLIVRMRFFGDAGFDAIAARIGVSRPAAISAFKRALKRLKKIAA